MTAFWLLAALLAALVVLVVLRPFLARRRAEGLSRDEVNLAVYRDQLRELEADRQAGTLAAPDYERARRELEARLLADVETAEAPAARRAGRSIAIALALAIPLGAAAVYFAVGNPEGLAPRPPAEAAEVTAEQIEAMVERLAARLKSDPGNVEGWVMLGRSYRVLGRLGEAAEAYARAAMLVPDDPHLLADYAEALASAREGRLSGEPEALVARALRLDANNLKALALSGAAAFEAGDYAGAARFWERMLLLVPRDSEEARSIQASLDRARARAARVR